MAKKNTPNFPKELLDQLLAGRDPKSALDSSGLIGDLKKALAERMLWCRQPGYR
jgi:putative transposase